MWKTNLQKIYVLLCVAALMLSAIYKILTPKKDYSYTNKILKEAICMIGEAASGEIKLYEAFEQASEYVFNSLLEDNIQEANNIGN